MAIGLALAGTDNIVLTALTYMERPYQFGGNDLYRMDCSAFVKRVFEVNGISLPRSTKEQAQVGVQVGLEDIKPGDLLFFSTYRPGPSHVGIYIGNGKMVHASESRGITIDRIDDPYWQRRFLFARRVDKRPVVAKAVKVDRGREDKGRDEIAELILILSNR
ncbi:MAG: C40 family peptidase [Aquificaceae bacterium]